MKQEERFFDFYVQKNVKVMRDNYIGECLLGDYPNNSQANMKTDFDMLTSSKGGEVNVNYGEIKMVSGFIFQLLRERDVVWEESLEYMLYIKKKFNIAEFVVLQRFVRMFGWLYRIVLINENGNENIAITIFADVGDEERNSIMGWTEKMHPEWKVVLLNTAFKDISIVGVRIPNNMYHERRLLLQGEVFD